MYCEESITIRKALIHLREDLATQRFGNRRAITVSKTNITRSAISDDTSSIDWGSESFSKIS